MNGFQTASKANSNWPAYEGESTNPTNKKWKKRMTLTTRFERYSKMYSLSFMALVATVVLIPSTLLPSTAMADSLESADLVCVSDTVKYTDGHTELYERFYIVLDDSSTTPCTQFVVNAVYVDSFQPSLLSFNSWRSYNPEQVTYDGIDVAIGDSDLDVYWGSCVPSAITYGLAVVEENDSGKACYDVQYSYSAFPTPTGETIEVVVHKIPSESELVDF